ncbi:MAG: hypothetical protein O2904_01935 [bacterium]|nr:hypothetical protein [bacterium]
MPKIMQIIGHSTQTAELIEDLEKGNLAHAYLFSGSPHLGKMTVAHWFSEQVLTLGLTDEGRANERRRIEHLSHPDFMVLDQLWIDKECDDWDIISQSSNVSQEHRSKTPPAKTDIISIDDVRALQHRLHATGVGKHRVCIISSMERMQDAAANAFLKILEEPPPNLVFILTAGSLSKLLPTICSRTRVMHFSPLSRNTLLPMLEHTSEDDAHFILQLAQGAPGTVKRLRDDPDALRQERQVQQHAISFWSSNSLKSRIHVLSALNNRGIDGDRLIMHLAFALRKLPVSDRQKSAPVFMQLLSDLQTNVQRRLVLQRFALAAKN